MEFPTPTLTAIRPILAAPLSNRYGLIGTAFDYLLRFYLERRNRQAKSRRWVAENGLSKLAGPMMCCVDVDTEKVTFAPDTKEFKAGRAALDRARTAHARYIANGKITDALLKGVIALAKLDNVYRHGYMDDDVGTAHSVDLKELRKLISIVNPLLFRSKKHCILNPTLGHASRLVRGADADLIIDGTLIEIKVTKTFRVDRDDFNQLIGYAALAEINRLNNKASTPRITKIGIYFARHAHLEVWKLRDFLNPDTLPSFLGWFSEKVGSRRVPVLARRSNRKAPAPTRRRITTRR